MKTTLITMLLGTAAAAAVITAPIAQADADPAVYLAVLDTSGVQYPSASKAVELGTAVCTDLRNGATIVSEGQDLVTSSRGSITSHDAGVIIGASAAALCPDQHARVQAEAAA
jgi:hypothetical protein